MKVRLKNFRYHRDREFEFPGEGLIALSGVSGSGKSTVLSAISYALYGKIPVAGKAVKPYSHDAKTSTVELDIFGVGDGSSTLHIVRDAKPKRLIVTLDDVEYEGDAAQSIIETEMSMNYAEFLAGAYIVQRSNASVLSMTPAEQIQFVELLANHNGPRGVQEFKEKIKDAIKDCKTSKLKKQGELEALEVQRDELIEEFKEIQDCEVPPEIQNGADPDQIREEVADCEADLVKINKELHGVQRSLNKMRDEERVHADARKKIQKLQAELGVYEKTLDDLIANGSIDDETINEAQQSVTDATDALKHYEACAKVYRDVLQLDEAIKSHYAALDEKINKIKGGEVGANIQDLEQKVEELTEQAKEYDTRAFAAAAGRKQKEEARKKLSDLFKQIKTNPIFSSEDQLAQIKTPNKMIAFLTEAVKISLSCPSCHSSLVYDERTSHVHVTTEENGGSSADRRLEAMRYIKLIEENGKALAVEIDDPGTDRPPLDDAIKELNKARRANEELEELEKRELSVTLARMQTRISEAAKKLDIDDTYEAAQLFFEDDGSDIQLALENAKQSLEDMKRVRAKITETTEEISKRKSVIKKLQASLPSSKNQKDISDLEKKLGTLTQRSGEIHADISSKRELLDSFADYEKYLAYENALEAIKAKIKTCNTRITKSDKKLEGLYGLEDAGKEAEILSLEETVKSINEHARFYIDEMFEDPISVKLSCIKELKSGKTPKLQLNTTIIDHEGHKYDGIDELSGGERQRCDMAFLLAVNDMLGARMLFLDECLNNLDAGINTDVLSMIRDLCGGNKLILVVSHEAVRGIFDSEVHFGKN